MVDAVDDALYRVAQSHFCHVFLQSVKLFGLSDKVKDGLDERRFSIAVADKHCGIVVGQCTGVFRLMVFGNVWRRNEH